MQLIMLKKKEGSFWLMIDIMIILVDMAKMTEIESKSLDFGYGIIV